MISKHVVNFILSDASTIAELRIMKIFNITLNFLNMKKLTLLAFVATILSCTQGNNKVTKDQLIGQWTNVTLDVTIDRSPELPDSNVVAREGEWENVLNIKPILTTLSEDGTFKSEYFTLENQPLFTSQGQWFLRNDSLIMTNEQGESAYACAINQDRATFTAKLDWDQDGVADDLYSGTQIRVQ